MPPITITDPVKDVAKINSAFQQLDALYSRLAAAEKQISFTQTTSQKHQQLAEITGVNNITFTWNGSSGTISWGAGSVLNRQGVHIPIPAGSITGLSASTTYWLAWNSIHQVMSYGTSLATIQPNKNNLVLCSVTTLGSGSSGAIGGGGTESGGVGFNRNIYATTGGSAGVTSLDGISGPVSLVAGANITITDNSPASGDIKIAASGGGGTIAVYSAPFYMNGGSDCGGANNIKINLFSLSANLATSKVTYRIWQTDASNDYSVGLYNASGTRVAHTTPGTLPANDTIVQASWVEGTVSLTPGTWFFAFTGQAKTGQLYSEGSGTPVTLHLLSTLVVTQTSTAGLLPTSITIPALTGSAVADNFIFILS